MQRIFHIENRADLEKKKKEIWSALCEYAENEFCLRLTDLIRSFLQNKKMWPMLRDFAKQKDFNGEKISTDDWKKILMSAWLVVEKDIRADIVQGLEREVVVLSGYKTSELGKKDFISFIEYLYYQGTEFNIKWSEPAQKAYDTYREAL